LFTINSGPGLAQKPSLTKVSYNPLILTLFVLVRLHLFIWSALIVGLANALQSEVRVFGISRQKRLNLVANETELLDQVARVMSRAREKDVGQKLDDANQPHSMEVNGERAPYFSVFPDTHNFDRVKVQIHREVNTFVHV
jgi:hypothetical protein